MKEKLSRNEGHKGKNRKGPVRETEPKEIIMRSIRKKISVCFVIKSFLPQNTQRNHINEH